MNLAEYDKTCFAISSLVIRRYSTSFSLGTRMFPKETRQAISAIYGFVRLADEIVDTFHEYDKRVLLANLRQEVEQTLALGISTNPILQAFQLTVRKYHIEKAHIEAFLKSMEMDLSLSRFTRAQYEEYIYGSAEVIGLMCLKVFCYQEESRHAELINSARHLGSAFQKVNFLRDIKSDLEYRGRIYFPGIAGPADFNDLSKKEIEKEIEEEFRSALNGIRRLPQSAKLAVYSTYLYYQALFFRLQSRPASDLLLRRVRVNNLYKTALLIRAFLKVNFRFI